MTQIEEALEMWMKLAFYGPTDFAVNDLLEKVCERRQCPYDGGDIDQTICKMTRLARSEFLTGCRSLEAGLTDSERAEYEANAKKWVTG